MDNERPVDLAAWAFSRQSEVLEIVSGYLGQTTDEAQGRSPGVLIAKKIWTHTSHTLVS